MKKIFCDKCGEDITVNAESRVHVHMKLEGRTCILSDKDLCRSCTAKLELNIQEIVGGR